MIRPRMTKVYLIVEVSKRGKRRTISIHAGRRGAEHRVETLVEKHPSKQFRIEESWDVVEC